MASLNARINELVEHTAKVRIVSEWDADEALVTTVVLNVGDNVAVNFALFKELADIFKSEAISVRHSSGERVYSEYTFGELVQLGVDHGGDRPDRGRCPPRRAARQRGAAGSRSCAGDGDRRARVRVSRARPTWLATWRARRTWASAGSRGRSEQGWPTEARGLLGRALGSAARYPEPRISGICGTAVVSWVAFAMPAG